MKTGDKIQFAGRTYTVTQIFGACPEAVKQIGIVQQVAIEGRRGATRLLQIFVDGTRRTITTSGRSEIEYEV